MNKNILLKGFTLIELLVVIAIIGILASIVVVYFPTATKSAKDSKVISAIGQMRSFMQEVYSTDGNYNNFSCNYSPEMQSLCNEVKENNGGTDVVIYTTESTACVYSPLTAKSGTWYCADSSGKAGTITQDPQSYCSQGGTGLCP